MSNIISYPSQPKKPFHHRNGSNELDVFEAARYFSDASENFTRVHKNVSDEAKQISDATQKFCMRPIGRMSLDMPNHRGNSIPLQAMLMEPMMVHKEKKPKQPSSPGGKLAHFLNSLFNQTSKKSKSKTKSTKDEDESPSGWRRKRRSSISHFSSANTSSSTATTTTTNTTATSTATIMSDSRSPFSTSTSSGFRTPPPYHIAHTPTKTTSYRDPRSYSYLKPPPTQITKIPINGDLKKIENFNIKCELIEKKTNLGNGFVDKVMIFGEKQDEYYHHKHALKEEIKEVKRFIDEDDGADSDSSSDLFELTNCDLGYCSSGLPVYETTHMDNIKRGAPISS